MSSDWCLQHRLFDGCCGSFCSYVGITICLLVMQANDPTTVESDVQSDSDRRVSMSPGSVAYNLARACRCSKRNATLFAALVAACILVFVGGVFVYDLWLKYFGEDDSQSSSR